MIILHWPTILFALMLATMNFLTVSSAVFCIRFLKDFEKMTFIEKDRYKIEILKAKTPLIAIGLFITGVNIAWFYYYFESFFYLLTFAWGSWFIAYKLPIKTLEFQYALFSFKTYTVLYLLMLFFSYMELRGWNGLGGSFIRI